MADVRAWTAELHSGCFSTEERYFSTEAITRVGYAVGVRVGRALSVGMAASVVVVCVLARRARAERMRMRVESMVVVGSWGLLVCGRLW